MEILKFAPEISEIFLNKTKFWLNESYKLKFSQMESIHALEKQFRDFRTRFRGF
jgi:hypothetical protein